MASSYSQIDLQRMALLKDDIFLMFSYDRDRGELVVLTEYFFNRHCWEI